MTLPTAFAELMSGSGRTRFLVESQLLHSSVPRVKDGRPVQDTFSEFLNEKDNVI